MREGWVQARLSDLLTRSIGGVWGAEPGTDQEEVTVVRSTEFTKSGILNFATGVPRSIKSSQLSSRELAEGDILLEKSGGGPDQPVGRVVYVESDIPRRHVCSNFIQLLTPSKERVLPRFLFLAMWQWHFDNKTLEYQAQTTGIRNLRTPDYLDQLIALPPLVKQHRIVDIVSSVDKYIAALQQQSDAARVARSAVLSELLSAGGEDRTQIAIHDMVELSRERVDPRFIDASTMLQHWSIPALDEVGGPIYESAAAIGSHKFRVRRNAVVYSLLNPRIPRYALIDGGEDVVCSTEFAVMYPKSIVLDTFLLVLVSSTLFQETVASSAMGTTKSRERVRPGDFESISLTLPPLVEQKRIVSIMSSIDGVIQSTERAVVEVKRLRSGLLSELLSGNHEIPESYDRLLGAA